MRRYRRGARFVMDPLALSSPLDRNQRARLLFLAEALERNTKAAGRRNGCLGYVGVAVLRVLLLRFQNGSTGLCVPSYEALQRSTGFCRASISEGLRRLSAAGIVHIVRRIERRRIVRHGRELVSTVQASNVYRFSEPSPMADQVRIESRQRFPACWRPMRTIDCGNFPQSTPLPVPRRVTASAALLECLRGQMYAGALT